MILEFAKYGIIHAAALVSVAAMMSKDQILLRGLLVVSTLLYILYYLTVPSQMLWDALFWTAINLGVNLVVISKLVLGRTQFEMTADERRLFAALGSLTPGEFRALMKIASWGRADGQQELLRQGEPVETVYYILDGAPQIDRDGRSFMAAGRSFVGEIGFLRQTPASATVSVAAGTLYVAFPARALARLLARRPLIKVSLDSLFSRDLAAKVAATA